MIDFNEFFDLLTKICDELPDEFFEELHQGVILDARIKISPYAQNGDMVIMGEYHTGPSGNRITIYYGSFERACSYMNEEELKKKLSEVIRHEFRHHLENRAGMHGKDSLEYEDYKEIQRYIRNRNRRAKKTGSIAFTRFGKKVFK